MRRNSRRDNSIFSCAHMKKKANYCSIMKWNLIQDECKWTPCSMQDGQDNTEVDRGGEKSDGDPGLSSENWGEGKTVL